MKATLEMLRGIRSELGDDTCEVEVSTYESGIMIRAWWRDESDLCVIRNFTEAEITGIVHESIIIDHFVRMAKETRGDLGGSTSETAPEHKCSNYAACEFFKDLEIGDTFRILGEIFAKVGPLTAAKVEGFYSFSESDNVIRESV